MTTTESGQTYRVTGWACTCDWDDVNSHPDYCLTSVGSVAPGRAPDGAGVDVVVSAGRRYLCPGDYPLELVRRITHHHAQIVQVETDPHGDDATEAGAARIDLPPAQARALAAWLVHAADIADGLR